MLAAFLFASVTTITPSPTSNPRSADIAIDRSVYDRLATQGLIVSHSPYARVLQRVGARIARAAAPHWFTERFFIVRGNDINAFASPGGSVFVYEGLLRSVDNVDELAAVLGHETAHLVLGHLDERMRARERLNVARQGAGILAVLGQRLSGSAYASQAFDVASAAGNYTFLNFTRQQEYAADRLGTLFATKAGFDPWGSVWFAQEVFRLVGDAGYEQYVQQHPSTKDRIAHLRAYILGNPQVFGKWRDVMPRSNGLPVTTATPARRS